VEGDYTIPLHPHLSLSPSPMSFLDDDFLLSTPVAQDLYHGGPRNSPIIRLHNHLSPKDMRRTGVSTTSADLLEGDHYSGAPCAQRRSRRPHHGKGTTVFEKFKAWSATVPPTLRNPLYVWTHLDCAGTSASPAARTNPRRRNLARPRNSLARSAHRHRIPRR